jgi:hypothetical protein
MPRRKLTSMRRKPSRSRRAASVRDAAPVHAEPAPSEARSDDAVAQSVSSLHELFQQQTRAMLERSDLDEEQKQNILIAMSCPCCAAGAMSYTVKLKR